MGKATKVLREDFNKAIRFVSVWLIVFLIAVVVVGGVFYVGITSVPSSATYLTNFNNLDATKLWNDFKTTQPRLDASFLESPFFSSSDVWINVSTMSWQEELFQPKTVISFHVSVHTALSSSYSLKLPSLLVLLLDQNDRIRGKLYTQQSSPDFFLTKENQTDYTFWFKVPTNMQNQQIAIVVELFGIVDYSSSINYQNLYADINDAVYGTIPSWQYQQPASAYFRMWGYDRIEAHTPTVYSFVSLALYSLTLAGLVSTLLSIPIWLRRQSEDWWKRNKMQAIFGILFLFTYIVILLLVRLIL